MGRFERGVYGIIYDENKHWKQLATNIKGLRTDKCPEDCVEESDG